MAVEKDAPPSVLSRSRDGPTKRQALPRIPLAFLFRDAVKQIRTRNRPTCGSIQSQDSRRQNRWTPQRSKLVQRFLIDTSGRTEVASVRLAAGKKGCLGSARQHLDSRRAC